MVLKGFSHVVFSVMSSKIKGHDVENRGKFDYHLLIVVFFAIFYKIITYI